MREYKEANENKDPKMGLYNTICENPAYWCKIHEVWLTEDDVIKKKCNCKPTFDMIGVRKCTALIPAKSVPMYERVYGNQ